MLASVEPLFIPEFEAPGESEEGDEEARDMIGGIVAVVQPQKSVCTSSSTTGQNVEHAQVVDLIYEAMPVTATFNMQKGHLARKSRRGKTDHSHCGSRLASLLVQPGLRIRTWVTIYLVLLPQTRSQPVQRHVGPGDRSYLRR